MGPNPVSGVGLRGETQAQSCKGDGPVTAETEGAVMLPEAKEGQESPEAGRGKEGVSPSAF